VTTRAPAHDSAAHAVRHPALEAFEGESTELAEAVLTDRQRLALVLQGVALLAHLEHGGWHLSRGWEGAGVDGDGRLRVPDAEPGRSPVLPQESAVDLLHRLFHTEDQVAGRGEGRRAARALLEEWAQELVAVPPDRLVAQVLEEAPFLWQPAFADSRRRLVAVHEHEDGPQLQVAGPRRWGDRLLALTTERDELEELAAGEVGRELWQTLREVSSTVAPSPDGDPTDPLAVARWLYRRGRFEACLDALAEMSFESGAVLRAGCHWYLDQLEAARRVLGRLERLEPAGSDLVAAGEVAVRVLHALGRSEAAREWVDRALEAGRGEGGVLHLRAELLGAAEAWDRKDPEAVDRHLEAARDALDTPELAWRWHHVAGLRALSRADSGTAARELSHALAAHRRGLSRFEAAGLWNDLAVARGQGGDLAGAERALRHSLRLYERCDGPKKVTLALQNLAEVRLRRGRPAGVREILERSSLAARRAGNQRARDYEAVLWARYELVHGRPEAALSQCRDALAALERRRAVGCRAELEVLTARALGWLGRSAEAATALTATAPEVREVLEPEEIAPLWTHAGERETALREIAEADRRDPTRGLWRRLLTGAPVQAADWRVLDRLGPFRRARWVFDAELAFPDRVPPDLRRRAIATFRRLGASWLAERLEARDTGPWQALATYLAQPGSGPPAENPGPALAELFAQAGYPDVRLWWERQEEQAVVLVDGPGGARELSAPSHGGRLVLTAPSGDNGDIGDGASVDPVLQALFRVAMRDFVPETPAVRPARGGMVGESPALVEALRRIERFAASELPVLVLGESGTGKELAARQIHHLSRRADGPFVALNCAALSETLALSDLFGHVRGSFTGADKDRAGVFETAQGGTVFLDEIGDLPATAQGMLLRVLQEGEVRRVGESLPRRVDVRLVAATHRDLEEAVRDKTFREDLFYRLRGAAVHLPPLRDRGRDVLLLADHLLGRQTRHRSPPGNSSGGGFSEPRLSAAARRRLLAHSWPGNVRELENVLGAAVALAPDGVIEPAHLELPEREAPASDYHRQVDSFRRRLVEEALVAAGGNQSEAARRLGLTRQALSYLVRTLGIELE